MVQQPSVSAAAGAAISGVVRDGDALIVRCGADLSQACIHCGRQATGKPVYVRWSGNAGAADVPEGGANPIGIALFALVTALVVKAARDDARRVYVTVGLCEAHRRRERRILTAAAVVLVLAIALLAGGLWGRFAALHSPEGLTNDFPTMAIIGGGLAAFLGPVLVLMRLRRPRITSETNGLAVLSGAGRPFLDAQRAAAGPSANSST